MTSTTTTNTNPTIKDAEQAFFRLDYESALDITASLLEESTDRNGAEICDENGPLALLYGRIMFKIGQKQQEERLSNIIAEAKERQENQMEDDVTSEGDVSMAQDDDDEEEEDALEEAWNLLEMARLCFEQQLEKNDKDFNCRRNMAEVHMLEAQVYAEQDQFSEAVEEYKKSLQFIQKDDLRKVSEVNCQIADFCMYAEKVDEALKHYKMAAETMESLIKESDDDLDREVLVDLHTRISEIEKNPKKYQQKPSLENTLQDLDKGGVKTSAGSMSDTGPANQDTAVNILQPRRK